MCVTWILFLFIIQSWNRNMVEVRSLVTGKRNYSDQAVRQVWRYIGWLGAWTTIAILVVIIVSSGLAALLPPPTCTGTPWQHSTSFLCLLYLFSNNGTSLEIFVYEMDTAQCPLASGQWTLLISEPPGHFYLVKLAFTLHEILQSIDKIASPVESSLMSKIKLLYKRRWFSFT